MRKLACAALSAVVVLGITGCNGGSDAIVGTWQCGVGNPVVFTAKTWSVPGTVTQDLPYKVDGKYVRVTTIRNQTLPMYKFYDGLLHQNMEGAGSDTPCQKT